MDRLSILLTLMTGALIAAPIVVTAFALGYYSVWPIVIAASVSLIAAWPIAYLISRRIKAQDPHWDKSAEPSALPDPKAPEV
jgi:hypothetical protein